MKKSTVKNEVIAPPSDEGYSSGIDFLFKAAQEEYGQAALTRRNMQYGLARQYLWVATAIIGGACALLARATELHLPIGFFAGYVAAISMAYVAFMMALTAMKGRGADAMPYRNAIGYYEEQLRDGYTEAAIKKGMFDLLNEGIKQSYAVITERGLCLRKVCLCLVAASFVLLVTAGCAEFEVWYGRG